MNARLSLKRASIAFAAIALVAALALALSPAAQAEDAAEQASAKSPMITATYAGTGKVTVQAGATYKLGAKASGAKLSYKSSNKAVATVTSKGAVKAKKAGKATITITAKKGKAKATKKVKVTVVAKKSYRQVKSIAAKAAKTALTVGQTATVKTTFKPAKASNKNLVYKSSNTKVLTVSAKGKVTAKSQGTAKITITSAANKKAKKTITFTVKAKATASSSSSAVGSKSSSSSAASGKSGSKSSSSGSGSGGSSSSSSSGTTPSGPAYSDDDIAEQAADYADAVAATIDASEATVSDDGTAATVSADALDAQPKAGQVVVIADENLQGTAIKVEQATDNGDGTYTIEGSQPEFEEVFDSLELKGTDYFGENDITYLAEGVELEGVEYESSNAGAGTLTTQAATSGTYAPQPSSSA